MDSFVTVLVANERCKALRVQRRHKGERPSVRLQCDGFSAFVCKVAAILASKRGYRQRISRRRILDETMLPKHMLPQNTGLFARME